MAHDTRPPYILLNDRLPSSYTSKLLGRIVADPLWPPDEFAPKSSIPVDISSLIEVTDEDVQLTIDANRGSAVGGRLGKVFGLTRTDGQGSTATLTGKRVITRNLEQHREVFDQLLTGAGREDILKLLSRKAQKRKAYMVVGIKSIVDMEVEETKRLSRTTTIEGEVPVAEVANAAVVAYTGIPVPGLVPELVNPGWTKKKTFSGEWLKKNMVPGECVFAVRYRVTTLKGPRWWSKKEPEAEYGRVHTTQTGHGVFADQDDDDDDDASGSESGDEQGEVTTEVVISNNLPQRLLSDFQIQE